MVLVLRHSIENRSNRNTIVSPFFLQMSGLKKISQFLEFYHIVLSLSLWGDQLCNRCVLFFADNEALVHVVNKQSCRDPSVMSFVRNIVSICLQHNILFKAKHIPEVHNILTDSLSHLQVASFKKIAPGAALGTNSPEYAALFGHMLFTLCCLP